LVELVTGEALFNTHENLEHLAMMEKVIGERIPISIINRISSTTIKNSNFKKDTGSSYSWSLNFPKPETTSKSKDFVSGLKRIDTLICSKLKKPKINIDLTKSMSKNWEINKASNKQLNNETFKFWYYFIDLVYKLLKFDPSKRISAIEALNHKWWDYGIVDEATSSML
jgi:dual-specificity kinase